MAVRQNVMMCIAALVLGACVPGMRTSPSRLYRVIEEDLIIEEAADRVGPALLFVVGTPTRTGDHLEFNVDPLRDFLNRPECEGSQACREYRLRFAAQYRMRNSCTGAFVSDDSTVFTAAHCLVASEFDQTYGILGFHANSKWNIVEGKIQVPVENVVRMCHVERCRYVERDDLAVLHVCPYDPARGLVEHETLELAPRQTPLDGPLWVYSHALGLPAKRYEAKPVSARRLRFTNFGSGSGSVVVDANDRVVAVVRGFGLRPFATCPGRSLACAGQWITPLAAIHAVLSNPSTRDCLWDGPIATNHDQPCTDTQTP